MRREDTDLCGWIDVVVGAFGSFFPDCLCFLGVIGNKVMS